MSRARTFAVWAGSAALGVLALPAAAQDIRIPPSFGSGTPPAGLYREDAASALARYLRVITARPRDLEALTGAGRAALEVGDPQAAIGFYARAESIAPRNGRIKAGLGSALVLLNQQQAALKYFGEAVSLGVPEGDIASDRGLAYDLRGSAKRAQQDYGVALRRGEDAETTRRMALSLAISGDRDAALRLLDPLLRQQDTAAWRARAFILAMTGDTAGASRAAESVMPASTAAGFAPFFRKLPTLKPGEKAAAVHFGLFPGEGRPMRIDDLFNQAEVAARVALENTPRSATDAGAVDASQSALGRLASRTPDPEGQLVARIGSAPAGRPVPQVSTPRPNATVTPVTRPATSAASTTTGRRSVAPATGNAIPPGDQRSIGAATRTSDAPARVPASTPAPASTPVRTATPAPAATGNGDPAPTARPGFGAVASSAPPPPTLTPSPQAAPARLADISATVRAAASEPAVRAVELPTSSVPELPTATENRTAGAGTGSLPTGRLAQLGAIIATGSAPQGPAVQPSVAITTPPPAPTPKVETPTAVASSAPRGTSAASSSDSPPPAPRPKVEAPKAGAPKAAATSGSAEDARIWVQIAGGADEKAFPAEWRKLKARAPELLTSQTAWTTPLKATNRLLVGPFDSDNDAQELVNKLKPKGITAFAWTSAKGQAIAKVAAR